MNKTEIDKHLDIFQKEFTQLGQCDTMSKLSNQLEKIKELIKRIHFDGYKEGFEKGMYDFKKIK